MVDYTNPVQTTFELQRQTLTQGQKAIENSLDVQAQFSEAMLSGIDASESAQRQLVDLTAESIQRTLDAVEAVPGADVATENLRTLVDDQHDELVANHEELFATFSEELEDGLDSYDEVSEEFIAALDEQLDLLVEAHENLEEQSVEATEQLNEQAEELQAQLEDVQEQVQNVSAQAADAVEA